MLFLEIRLYIFGYDGISLLSQAFETLWIFNETPKFSSSDTVTKDSTLKHRLYIVYALDISRTIRLSNPSAVSGSLICTYTYDGHLKKILSFSKTEWHNQDRFSLDF